MCEEQKKQQLTEERAREIARQEAQQIVREMWDTILEMEVGEA